MFLLSYALGVRIRVYRPSQHGQPDFCTIYAEDDDVTRDDDDVTGDALPIVDLVADDDRHYNVLL